MEDERKYYLFLSLILLTLSSLLLIKFLPNIVFWNTSSNSFIFDILGLIWPFFGISCAIEFLLKDKWGWGGILFHIFILYCAIYYLIMTIIAGFNFSHQLEFLLPFLLNLAITVLGWFGFLLYYD